MSNQHKKKILIVLLCGEFFYECLCKGNISNSRGCNCMFLSSQSIATTSVIGYPTHAVTHYSSYPVYSKYNIRCEIKIQINLENRMNYS